MTIYSRLLTALAHRRTCAGAPSEQALAPRSREQVLGIGHRCTITTNERVEQRMLDSQRRVVDAELPDADVAVATCWETSEQVALLAPSKGRKVYFVQGHEVYEWLPQASSPST